MPMADPVYPDREARAVDPLHPPLAGKELPEHATPSQIGHIPATPANPRLNSAAESVGTALGTAVNRVRQLPDRLQDAKSRFTVIRGRKGRDVKEEAKEAAENAVNRIREVSADVQDQARDTVAQARTRADYLAHERPLDFIAGAAAFGMILGIGLRIWRDHAS